MTDASLRSRALVMWKFQKLGTDEIAKRLGVAEWRVYNQLAIARGQVDTGTFRRTRAKPNVTVPIMTRDGFLIYSKRVH
jgi:hypothetical protein